MADPQQGRNSFNGEPIEPQEKIETEKVFDKNDIQPGDISQRLITEGSILVQGLATNRPTEPGVNSHTRFYFSTDSNVLSVYNGVSGAWVSTTLS